MKQVTRYLTLLVIILSMFSGAQADVIPVRILLGTSEAPLAPSPVFDGAGVLAPIQILTSLGASYVGSSDGADLIVASASGNTGSIKTVNVSGTPMVPMDKVMALIGGEHIWNPSKKTLTLTARLESVEFDNDTLKINCSFPVRATAKIWEGKIVVDVANAKVVSEAKEIFIGAPTVNKARLGQYNDTTARVVLELNKPTGCKLASTSASAQITLRVGDGLVPDPAPLSVATTAQPTKGQPFTINTVDVQTVNEESFKVVLGTSRRATARSELSVTPPAARIDLPMGQLAQSCTVTGSHPLVQPELIKTDSGTRLTLRFARPMVYNVEVRDTETMIYVHPPDNAGGTLAGKYVVVDPGHGGREAGAVAAGCREKDINYRIATELVATLRKLGVKAMLTRNGDEAVALSARPEIAVSAGADFFVSIHCNSNVAANSATGIETYYHMQEPSPKLLAYAIHDGVCKYTGMCDRRARSDRSLYDSGLGVLRRLEGTGVPGVLLECGYVNNASDRAKLLDAGHRSKLISGIVAGLRAYVEGTPIQ